jgi:ribosomal protein L15
MGPLTGRAAGFCAGYGVPGFMNPLPGRGFGMGFGAGRGFGGRGGGRGWRNMFYATGLPGWMRFGWGGVAPMAQPTPDVERDFLKGQAEALQAQLDEIRKRLDELAAQAAQKPQ